MVGNSIVLATSLNPKDQSIFAYHDLNVYFVLCLLVVCGSENQIFLNKQMIELFDLPCFYLRNIFRSKFFKCTKFFWRFSTKENFIFDQCLESLASYFSKILSRDHLLVPASNSMYYVMLQHQYIAWWITLKLAWHSHIKIHYCMAEFFRKDLIFALKAKMKIKSSKFYLVDWNSMVYISNFHFKILRKFNVVNCKKSVKKIPWLYGIQ